ncbi:MerR family transcriptional regulator [Actinomarinicola tropica]|uniref:MerR family DNA-binding transcriptional regulator n=1 Tax=Actinomarinicola tropica TaxID=2789776 RepID=A0A5Q2RID6_9ACTN|nr:MerR family DNA-binding transcriptional regulator [Actinomarinicola tropica]QGG96628.1 MerR family DNA-binding transcriptional regulator [Actinomarinicola tropica]
MALTDATSARPHREGIAPDGATVSEVAAASGVAPSAVRFYEQHGLIHAVRTAGNQRRFDPSAVCRIQVAKLAQRVGLTVREIAELFSDLPGDPGPEEWGRVADRLCVEAQQRVDDLRERLEALASGERLCDLGAALSG